MHTFIGQMFPFVRLQDNSQDFLLIWACSPMDEASGCLSISAGVAQDAKLLKALLCRFQSWEVFVQHAYYVHSMPECMVPGRV